MSTSTTHPLAQHPIVVYCREKIDDLAGAVPRQFRELLPAEGILQAVIALLADSKAEKLRACVPASFFDSLIGGLRLGLDPAPGRGEMYLVPRKADDVWVATLQIGSQGKIALAYRSGLVTKIVCNVVYEDDDYQVDLANGVMTHVLTKERIASTPGRILCSYARIWTKGAIDPIDEVMRPADFAKIKAAATKFGESGAWKEWESEMWRRSVLNRALKRAPRSVALAEALDEEVGASPSVSVTPTPRPADPAPADVEARLSQLRDDVPPFNGSSGADASEMP